MPNLGLSTTIRRTEKYVFAAEFVTNGQWRETVWDIVAPGLK